MKYPETESSTLEFKKEIPENDQIVKTIIGFCNRNGGKLILGVDNQGTIVGIPESQVQTILEYIHKTIFDAAAPTILPEVYSQCIGDKILLIIEVSSGMNKPYFRKAEGLDKGTYIRLGRSTLKATPDMIEELKWQARGKSFDMMPLYAATEADLDRKKLVEFIRSKKGVKVKTISPTLLTSYQLMVEEHSTTYPTTGGILLFGAQPQKFFPEAILSCTHFAGTSGRKSLASISCSGSLFEQFDTAYDFITKRLSRSFSIEGPRRKERLEVPETAIRELLLNAIIHRNYHINASIKVSIYDNRIEIFSPGGFAGPIDTQNFRLGLSYIRNMVIARVFWEMGYVEKLGTGFTSVFESYSAYDLATPEIMEGENFIKCTLPRAGFISEKTAGTGEVERLFQVANDVAISDVMSAWQLTRATAGRRLKELVDKGILIQVGRGKGARYKRL